MGAVMVNFRRDFYAYHRETAPEISAADRALIDAAVAAGKVTKVPVGASTTSRDYVWDGKHLVIKSGPAEKSWKEQNGEVFRRRPANSKTKERVVK